MDHLPTDQVAKFVFPVRGAMACNFAEDGALIVDQCTGIVVLEFRPPTREQMAALRNGLTIVLRPWADSLEGCHMEPIVCFFPDVVLPNNGYYGV